MMTSSQTLIKFSLGYLTESVISVKLTEAVHAIIGEFGYLEPELFTGIIFFYVIQELGLKRTVIQCKNLFPQQEIKY